ncbi:Probable RNA-directed DNA polymerase from transposon BS [Eumeta japonica]|uniref:Probable RNA-directed DNA polymerase from transposon BS n=1 Tax=Eumeta variegata TaxID=151549 RepID=A0A4C1ZP68_EUMVA|nr:Probable RNA-directed DNA polymerase from transposon BS [Eumeta japonica]
MVELDQCTKEYGIDIVLVQETLLKPNSPKSCTLAGYVQLRTDRTDAPLGGTAVYYKRSLQCCPIDLPTLSNIEATGDAVILFGDFNCKHTNWGCAVSNPGGNKLAKLSRKLKFDIVAPLTPTHYPDDLVSRPSTIDIAITKEIALNVDCIEPIYRLVSDHRPVLLRTVVKKCSREVPASVDRRKLPADAFELLRAKNAALRLAYAYPSRENRSRARALQRRVRARMIEVKNEEWSNLMEDISPHIKPFGKRSVKTSLDPLDDLPPVSLDEVQKLVKGLKARKAPGLDGISNKAIKCFPLTLLSLLVTIFNACLKNSYFPPVWKEAEVIGIPKPGKPRNLPASYRPISLLSGLGKVYEKILKTRLSEYLFGKGLIINEQFGFRPNHSCPQQALRLVEYITEGFKTKKRTVAVFFDVAKAFDRTRKHTLVQKNDKREYLKAPRSPLLYPCTLTIYRVRRQASSSHCSQMIPPCTYAVRRNETFALTSRRPSRSWLDGFKPGGSRTVLTYASPVFAHAAPKRLKKNCKSYRTNSAEPPPMHTGHLPRSGPLSVWIKNGPNPCWCSSDCQCQGDLRPHKASHAPPTPPRVARPHTVKLNRIPANSIADPITFCQGIFGFQSTLPTRTGARVRNGNRPVTVPGDILCRDDTLQESSIGHVTRRRHSHVPSGRAR